MDAINLKTDNQVKQEAKEQAVYDDYQRLMETPGAMKTKVTEAVMATHGISSSTTVWNYINRVKDRQNQEK